VADVVNATKGLDVLVVDSFSKLQVAKVKSTLKTEKIALKNIIAAAKRNKCCVVLITHNTKTGQSKGTSQVQHDVDATLYIEKLKDEPTLRRVWFDKNRFGAPAEIHLEMTASGLILELRASPEEGRCWTSSLQKELWMLGWLLVGVKWITPDRRCFSESWAQWDRWSSMVGARTLRTN
jgi:hypothetical protein